MPVGARVHGLVTDHTARRCGAGDDPGRSLTGKEHLLVSCGALLNPRRTKRIVFRHRSPT